MEGAHDSRIAHRDHEPVRDSPRWHRVTEASAACHVPLFLCASVVRTPYGGGVPPSPRLTAVPDRSPGTWQRFPANGCLHSARFRWHSNRRVDGPPPPPAMTPVVRPPPAAPTQCLPTSRLDSNHSACQRHPGFTTGQTTCLRKPLGAPEHPYCPADAP
jgi:hypothetical protein